MTHKTPIGSHCLPHIYSVHPFGESRAVKVTPCAVGRSSKSWYCSFNAFCIQQNFDKYLEFFIQEKHHRTLEYKEGQQNSFRAVLRISMMTNGCSCPIWCVDKFLFLSPSFLEFIVNNKQLMFPAKKLWVGKYLEFLGVKPEEGEVWRAEGLR